MDQQHIKSLIDALAASDLAELEFSQDGWTLRLVKRDATQSASVAAVAAPVAAAPDAPGLVSADLAAPLYGVVHLRPSPDEPPFVEAGQAVRAGQTLCVIEAMKVFNEVRAEHDATVAAVLVATGQEVEAGQALFRLV